MRGSSAIRTVAVFSSGMMAGLLFGDWLGPAFARAAMPEASFIQFQQIVHTNYLRTLPALSTIAVLSTVVWTVTLRQQRWRRDFNLVLVAAVMLVVGQAITFTINVPVNDLLETWNPTAPPSNARAIWERWEAAHVVRTIFWTAGFLCTVIALTLAPGRVASKAGDRAAA